MRKKSWRPGTEQLESRALMAVFSVTSTATAGPGTLRAAINQANQSPGADVIDFRFEGEAVIRVGSQALPPITGRVVIDGYTHPGAARNTSTDPAVNNAVLPVQIVGNNGPAVLTVNPRGGGSQIRGLTILNEGGGASAGVEINQADQVTLDGNAFGALGQARLSTAVRIVGGSRNTVGGDAAADPALQNVMRTYTTGVELVGPSRHNAVAGNIIGGPTYETRAPLQVVGVWLRPAASNNTIIKNHLFKNATAIRNEGVGNVVEDNTIVPA